MTEAREECTRFSEGGTACPGVQAEAMLRDGSGCPFVWRLGEVTSTLDAARTLMDAGLLAPWESVQAVRQTSGRGQLRRQWISPAGNIYATLRLPQADPFLGSEATPALSLMLAAACAELGLSVWVKWPNDLWLADGKLAGILCETCRDKAGGLHVAAGIGVNIALDSEVSAALAAGGCRAARRIRPMPAGGMVRSCIRPGWSMSSIMRSVSSSTMM